MNLYLTDDPSIPEGQEPEYPRPDSHLTERTEDFREGRAVTRQGRSKRVRVTGRTFENQV